MSSRMVSSPFSYKTPVVLLIYIYTRLITGLLKNLDKGKQIHCHLINGYLVTINEDENYAVMFSNIMNCNRTIQICDKPETENT